MRRNLHASAAPFAAGRPAKRTAGLARAAMNGTRSTLAGCALPACTIGLTLSASHAADGRHIRTGTLPEREFKEAISEVR